MSAEIVDIYASERRAGASFARSERNVAAGDPYASMANALDDSIRRTIAGRSGFAYNAWQEAYQQEAGRPWA